MPVALTPEKWSELRKVNSAVNRFTYRFDQDRYHQPEFWERIDRKGGDCEDYALEKRARLIALGWPVEDLRLCICTVDGQGHCVLTVDTAEGTYVLDNITGGVSAWKHVPYRWIMRQRGKEWVKIDGSDT